MSPAQLPLALGQPGGQDFVHFLALDAGKAVERLRRFASAPGAERILLSGPADSGKTHLALACCGLAAEAGHALAYLPLARVDAAMLDAVPPLTLVVVDDACRASEDRARAEALFRLLNRQHDQRTAVLVAGRKLPGDPQQMLPDLVSRLAQMESLALPGHDDAGRLAILLHHAALAGTPLDPPAAEYLLRHHDRRLSSLLDALRQLDRESLARGRRISLPLVREWLAG